MAEEAQKAGPFAASSPPRRIAQRLGLVVLACGAVLALSAVLLSSTSPRTALVQEERGMAGDVEAQSAEEAKLPASLQLAAAPGAAGRARLQELSYADDLEFKQPYVPGGSPPLPPPSSVFDKASQESYCAGCWKDSPGRPFLSTGSKYWGRRNGSDLLSWIPRAPNYASINETAG